MTPAEDARSIMINNVSWGAVFAGVVVGLVAQVIINMIGVGIGAATLDPGTGDNPGVAGFSIGAGIWFAISGILGALAGGFTAGRLSGKAKESTASWHGLTSWALATLVVVYLVSSSIGGIVGGAYSTLTSAVGNVAGAAGTAVEAAGPNPFSAIEQTFQSAIPEDADPAAMRDAAIASVRSALTGDAEGAEQAEAQAVRAIAEAQGIPQQEAQAQFDQFQAQYTETVEQAKQTADTASAAVSTSALLGALGLILGAVAAWFGGRMGAVDPTITRHRVV
ncbi:PhnA-like protein [Palleronia aestuarii]|uniref:PhnA-like protein n=1 Tax=Palleronia aestuarii TaxID=568105 RepID=UPI00147418DA|nr:PhnA-like protein [Palleronia aestuarii]